MATRPVSYDIINGPSREELFDTLRLRSERGPLNPRTTEFTLVASLDGQEEGVKLPFVVNGIVDTETADVDYILYLDGGQLGRLRAMYNVQRRRGRLEKIAPAEDRLLGLWLIIEQMMAYSNPRNVNEYMVGYLKVPASETQRVNDAIFKLYELAKKIRHAESEETVQKALRELKARK